MNEPTSTWRFYSLGIVAENKPLGLNRIMVTPVEHTPMLDGELTTGMSPVQSTGTDNSGKQYNVSVNTDTAIQADWFQDGSNRSTAPDVRRGERVALYTFGDTNKFRWKPWGDEHLRRLETVRHSYNNNPKIESASPGDVPTPEEDTHYFEVSAHGKYITLKTSQSNGEPFGYTFQLNMGTGAFVAQDTAGNVVQLNSADNHILIKNQNTTFFEIHQNDINGFAPDNFTLNIGKKATINVGEDVEINVGQNVTTTISGDNTTQIAQNNALTVGQNDTTTVTGASTTTSTGPMALNSDATIDSTAPVVSLNGVIGLNGPITQTNSPTGDFTANMKGPLNVDTTVNATVDMTVAGKPVLPHTHDTPDGESGPMK